MRMVSSMMHTCRASLPKAVEMDVHAALACASAASSPSRSVATMVVLSSSGSVSYPVTFLVVGPTTASMRYFIGGLQRRCYVDSVGPLARDGRRGSVEQSLLRSGVRCGQRER